MKSKMKRRMLAIVLCMVIVLSNSSFIFASSESGTPAVEAASTEGTTSQTETDTQGTETTPQTLAVSESTPAPTDEPAAPTSVEATPTPTDTPEVTTTPEPTGTPTPEATPTPTDTPETTTIPEPTDAPEITTTPEPTDTPEATTTPEPTDTQEATPTPTQGPENGTSDTAQPTETPTEVLDESDQTNPLPFEGTYEDDMVKINVSADAGIVPEGAELSVTPITKTEITADMTAKEKAEAEAINDQYDFTAEKLEKDSQNNEKSIEGFIAYDISFLVDGQETEPYGDVNVIMEFKNSTSPDGISENAEVAVKHLKSDAQAEDGIIVEDLTEKAKVQTETDDKAVKKVELQSDSFSTYTVTWLGTDRSLQLKYVNSVRRDIDGGRNGAKTINANEVVQLKDYETTIPQYDYVKTYVYIDQEEIEVDAIRVVRIGSDYYTYYQVEYRDIANGEWNEWEINRNGSYNVYYEYVRTSQIDVSPIENTVDTSEKITLKLFDYNITSHDSTVGNMKNFEFNGGNGSGANKWTGSSETYPGILQSTMLMDGLGNYTFPKFSFNFGNDSFSQLFSDEPADRKTVYDANKLFTLDEDGYYEYDSYKNYAYYDQSKKEFIVYNVPATVSSISSSHGTVPGFFPFNNIERNRYGNYVLKDGYINATPNDKNSGNAYQTDTNYWFGMSMQAQFVQTEKGEVNGNDMIFDFAGDDDVWVFIDGVLVLDIGGIHNEAGGSINFKTGEVYVNGNSQGTLKEIFRRAGRDVSTGFTGNTFEDYTAHQINFYYLERGAGASDCRLKFNLEIIPEGEIQIEKRLEEETDPVLYGDVKFGFELSVETSDDEGQGTGHLEKVTSTAEGSYGYGAVKKTVSGTEEPLTMEDGIFYLKPGETAIFKNIPKNLNYKVVEVDIQSDEFDQVIINTTKVIDSDGTVYAADSGEEIVAKRPWLIFTNSCNAKNLRTLTIEKKMKDGGSSDDMFTVNVQLEGSDGNLSAFSGVYRLMDEYGYTIDENGQKQNDSYRLTTSDGKIRLQAGWKILIYNILSENKFKVVEEDPDFTVYNSPLYSVSVDGGENYEESTESAEGTIQLDKHAYAIVTNSRADVPDEIYIEVQKQFVGLTQEQIDYLKDFTIQVKDANSNVVAILKLQEGLSSSNMEGVRVSDPLKDTIDNTITYTWKIFGVSDGTYTVDESGESIIDYTVITKVKGANYDESSGAKLQNPSYTVTPVKDDGKIPTQGNSTFKFEEVNVIVISFTGQEGYLIWTVDMLSMGERKAIVDAIADSSSGQFNNNLKTGPKVYFSDRQIIENGFDYRGHISVNEDRTLQFAGTNQWNMIWAGRYIKNSGVNAEIEIENSYTESLIDIDIKKYGKDYANEYDGAKFSLYKGVLDTDGQSISWESNPISDEFANFEVTISNKSELKSLTSGYYKLVETQAPTGFQLLNDSIYFKVENRSVTLIDGNTGNQIPDEQNMWKVEIVDDTITIKIKNEALYDLPSAGSSGIFGYTMGGTLLLMAGALILYKMKRKEVQES